MSKEQVMSAKHHQWLRKKQQSVYCPLTYNWSTDSFNYLNHQIQGPERIALSSTSSQQRSLDLDLLLASTWWLLPQTFLAPSCQTSGCQHRNYSTDTGTTCSKMCVCVCVCVCGLSGGGGARGGACLFAFILLLLLFFYIWLLSGFFYTPDTATWHHSLWSCSSESGIRTPHKDTIKSEHQTSQPDEVIQADCFFTKQRAWGGNLWV